MYLSVTLVVFVASHLLKWTRKILAVIKWTLTINNVMAYSKSLLAHLTKNFYYNFVCVWMILFTFCPFVQPCHNDNKFLDSPLIWPECPKCMEAWCMHFVICILQKHCCNRTALFILHGSVIQLEHASEYCLL